MTFCQPPPLFSSMIKRGPFLHLANVCVPHILILIVMDFYLYLVFSFRALLMGLKIICPQRCSTFHATWPILKKMPLNVAYRAKSFILGP